MVLNNKKNGTKNGSKDAPKSETAPLHDGCYRLSEEEARALKDKNDQFNALKLLLAEKDVAVLRAERDRDAARQLYEQKEAEIVAIVRAHGQTRGHGIEAKLHYDFETATLAVA